MQPGKTTQGKVEQGLKVVGLASVACIAVFFLFHLLEESDQKDRRAPLPQHHFRLTLLDQQAAAPGKMIVTQNAAYVCRPRDAAVAVVQVSDLDNPKSSATNQMGSMRLDFATDREGRKYDVSIHRVANTFFIMILKGFQKRPATITFKADLIPTGSENALYTPKPEASLDVSFTKIAPPVQQFSLPSVTEQRAAEKVAVVEYVEDHKYLSLKVVQKMPSNEYLAPRQIATPYSVPIYTSDQNEDLAFQTAYCSSASSVRVLYGRFRRTYVEADLIYKNAEIDSIGGCRYLILPQDETVGVIDGCPAVILKEGGESFRSLHAKKPHGKIRMQLVQRRPGWPHIPDGALSCVGVSPSIDEMGLDWLNVNLDGYPLNETLKGSASGGHANRLTKIPELKLRIRLRNDVKIGSTTVILPIHHVKRDLVLFPTSEAKGGPGLRY